MGLSFPRRAIVSSSRDLALGCFSVSDKNRAMGMIGSSLTLAEQSESLELGIIAEGKIPVDVEGLRGLFTLCGNGSSCDHLTEEVRKCEQILVFV